uniref:Uncharacterized protein n=1 Tax=Rhipicephalus microplus TaxID=6941 RepID=A0A6M2D874_RHIMP
MNSSSDLMPPVDRVWVLELTSFGGLLFALAKDDSNEFLSSVCTPMSWRTIRVFSRSAMISAATIFASRWSTSSFTFDEKKEASGISPQPPFRFPGMCSKPTGLSTSGNGFGGFPVMDVDVELPGTLGPYGSSSPTNSSLSSLAPSSEGTRDGKRGSSSTALASGSKSPKVLKLFVVSQSRRSLLLNSSGLSCGTPLGLFPCQTTSKCTISLPPLLTPTI